MSTVTQLVGRLRAKLEENLRRPRLLKTVRGVGYRFDRHHPSNLTREA
jgi:DNA-binding response OmpR family regulator